MGGMLVSVIHLTSLGRKLVGECDSMSWKTVADIVLSWCSAKWLHAVNLLLTHPHCIRVVVVLFPCYTCVIIVI